MSDFCMLYVEGIFGRCHCSSHQTHSRMCHTNRLEVLLGSWSGSPHSRWCTWQQCMSRGAVRLRLVGDRRSELVGEQDSFISSR